VVGSWWGIYIGSEIKARSVAQTSRHCKEIGKLAQYALGPFIDWSGQERNPRHKAYNVHPTVPRKSSGTSPSNLKKIEHT
jgi:hypothetical protein